MNLGFITVLINVAVLLILGVPTYILRKIKIFDSASSKPLVIILIYVTQPFLILMSFQGMEYSVALLKSMGWIFALTIIIHVAILFLAKVIFSKFKIEKSKKGVLTFASAFSNCGYIGIPIIKALYGSTPYIYEMLIYLTVYLVVFNIINWTLGIYLISGNKKYISLKNAFINPTTCALLFALPLFFLNLSISQFSAPLANVFDMISNMTTPLSMMILGIKLAEIKLIEVFNNGLVYICSFIKLFVMPLLMLAIIYIIPYQFSLQMTAIMFFISAMPTATITVANAERFGGDAALAAKCMLCSTIFCIITIPVLSLLM